MAPVRGSRMRDDNDRLDLVLDSIERGSSQTEREKGLIKLKECFDGSQGGSNIEMLSDKGYHRIFEVLFKVALTEKSASISSKPAAKAKPATLKRLALCGDALRLSLGRAVPKLKVKTIEALVDHITQTLPKSSGGFFEPLAANYLKSLSTVLEREANVERLKPEVWLDTINFCLQAIDHYLEFHEGDSGLSNSFSGLGTIQNSRSHSVLSNGPGDTKSGTLTRQNLEEVFLILRSLVTCPNAPLLQRYSVIVDSAVRYLQLQSSVTGQTTLFALSAINAVLRETRDQQISFTQSLAVRSLSIVARFWQGKSTSKDELLNSVREEMMIMLFLSHPHLERVVKDGITEELTMRLKELVDILRTEYSKRSDRDPQLQLDDLEMPGFGCSFQKSFRLNAFQLRSHNIKGERDWATIQMIAILERLLSIVSIAPIDEVVRDDEQELHPSKRQRTSQVSDRLVEPLLSGDEKVRLCGLQTIPFFLQNTQLSASELSTLLRYLHLCVGDRRGHISSWALLGIASCAFQEAASTTEVTERMQLWRAGTRCLTFSTTCRAAALALHALLARGVVIYRDVGEDVEAMISAADTSGPAIVCDSSIHLMAHLLQTRVTEAPGASLLASQHVIRWFFRHWKPVDRDFAIHYAAHIQPHDILLLLRTSLGLPQLPIHPSILPCGPIAQAWECHLRTRDVVNYLLLLDPPNDDSLSWKCLSCPKASKFGKVVYTSTSSHFLSARKLILELVRPKSAKILQDWTSYLAGRSSPVSVDLYRSTLNGAIAMLLLMPHYSDVSSELFQAYSTDLKEFSKSLVRFYGDIEARDPQAVQNLNGIILQCIQPVLPPSGADSFRELLTKQTSLVEFLASISDHLRKYRTNSQDSSFAHDEDDLMDLDDEFSSRQSQPKLKGVHIKMPRTNLAVELWSGSFDLTTSGRLELITAISLLPEHLGHVPATYVDYALSLSIEEFLASHQTIVEVLNSDLVVSESDANRLIENLAEALGSDELDRCEVTFSVCVNVLAALEPMWFAQSDNDVSDSAFQIYQWLITKTLGKGIASPDVQVSISRLLLILLGRSQPYGEEQKLPSPRSLLFQILETSVARVKFFVASQLPQIFEHFILRDHEAMFVDILQILPVSEEWIEGICLRLYVFAGIGSRWPTLLRRSVYHIFEIPPRIPEALQHATRCMEEISSNLKVANSRELFALFAPQTLFTWLDSAKISEIPYEIFGFKTLRELVDQAKDEATAIMVIYGQDTGPITEILGITEAELFERCFTKVMAYSIAHDLCTPPTSSTKKNGTAEARVKTCLGDAFATTLYHHFTDIIATFFVIVDQGTPFEKALKKNESYVYAAGISETIKSLGHSIEELPPNQQPHFKAKFLTAQIERLFRKVEYQQANLYTPAFVTSVVRKLLDTVHPTLGSLHACSVIRKIRMLLSLAGDSALKGYPIEMLLQSIAPFLKDTHCAEDATGIIQYLLQEGNMYLLQVPSFVAGMSLRILGTLRRFMDSSKDSTTQGSQFDKSKSKVELCRKWMGTYLNNYKSPALSSVAQRERFTALMQDALRSGSVGGAEQGTSESKLLIQLLDDERGSEELLSRPSRQLALSMLSSNFHSPISFRVDVLGSDASSADYASVVWKSCSASNNKDYQCWGARVLGRAFVASGHVHEELLRETTLTQIKSLTPSNASADSITTVLCLLRELTLGHESKTVGLAESALRFTLSNADELLLDFCKDTLPESLLAACTWLPYNLPPSDMSTVQAGGSDSLLRIQAQNAIASDNWIRDASLALTSSVPEDPVLGALAPVISNVSGFAAHAFPFLVHLAISSPYQGRKVGKKELSAVFMTWLETLVPEAKNNLKVIINALIYLRTQPVENEANTSQRARWLDIDYLKASKAATFCGMYKTSLLFFEDFYSLPTKSSRRSSAIKESVEQSELDNDALLQIYENIDDPDLYYGVQQHSNLDTILARFEYEKDGPKSLAFRGAQYDNHVRKQAPRAKDDVQSLVKALDALDLSGLSHSLLQGQQAVGMTPAAIESMFRTARKLEQWDLPVPSTYDNNAVAIYKVFQAVHTALDRSTIIQAVNEGLEWTMSNLAKGELSATTLHESLQSLAALVEIDEVLGSCGSEQFEEVRNRFKSRSPWMKVGRFDDISQILSCRGTTLSTLSQRPRLQEIVQVKSLDSRLVEVQTALLSAGINRAHNVLQESLSLATSMMDLIKPCHEVGINPEVAIHLEAANALWDQGEMLSSIGMLQNLDDPVLLKKQTVIVGRSDLLSKIGHQVSVARLEKPDKIIDKYLKPALKELKAKTTGSEAGQVFHQFAVFCDQQLQDPDSKEDLERLKRLTKSKSEEVRFYDKLIAKASSTNEKNRHKSAQAKSRTWLRLDQDELKRHNESREVFLGQCLENYLLALAASDDHNNTALRFSALWLEHSEDTIANDAVSNQLKKVPSRKFAPLMNQLASRLQDNSTKFQLEVFQLVLRICTDHPYHGMYQIYTAYRTPAKAEDESATGRRHAAVKIASSLSATPETKGVWTAIKSTGDVYCKLALEEDKSRYTAGRKIKIKDSAAAMSLSTQINKHKLPPPTLKIPLAPDCDYSKVPVAVNLEAEMSIASGVSAPKIIVTRTDTGVRFKQLVKGGNDDLRQDAIMEQVFEQVSELLKINKSTQQRNLSIRTYRVLPLTNTAGVIEFVADTQPFHDYLIPAHERYNPKDIKAKQCRKEIGDAQALSLEKRIKAFRGAIERFHPVMRHFFTEKFTDPDEWFVRRLAYTRSTAAISMLGHVLGLGDRHGHNILMDTKSGEVVHIDLGCSFEQGRILPVPELVPFRLTRDVVDGFGITKTEGVFRRCCEFTLDALRNERYTIMSVLDVLRYDPLYSWSISPVRLAKLQEGQSAAPDAVDGGAGEVLPQMKKNTNEPSEADRALTVVEKKLSKNLSVTATVNDLINQASDERNLAVLYSGWAAYA